MFPHTFGSFDALGILNVARVDMFAMRGIVAGDLLLRRPKLLRLLVAMNIEKRDAEMLRERDTEVLE